MNEGYGIYLEKWREFFIALVSSIIGTGSSPIGANFLTEAIAINRKLSRSDGKPFASETCI